MEVAAEEPEKTSVGPLGLGLSRTRGEAPVTEPAKPSVGILGLGPDRPIGPRLPAL